MAKINAARKELPRHEYNIKLHTLNHTLEIEKLKELGYEISEEETAATSGPRIYTGSLRRS